MDTYNAQLDTPRHIPNIETKAKEEKLEDRVVEFIESLPPPMQAYIRAKLMEMESGEMPMPPGMELPVPSFAPPLP